MITPLRRSIMDGRNARVTANTCRRLTSYIRCHDSGVDFSKRTSGRLAMPANRLIFAGVSGSPGSVHALRYAADLARRHGAALVPVLAWVPTWRRSGRTQIPRSRAAPAVEAGRLAAAARRDRHRVRRLPARRAHLAAGAARPGRPGTGQPRQSARRPAGHQRRPPTALTRLVCCPVARHCLAHAHCPVLAVPPPDLAQHAGHGLRGWAFRHRGLDPGKASLPAGTS